MRRSFAFFTFAVLLNPVLLTSCKTSSTSDLHYADEPTDIESIKAKTCPHYTYDTKCTLRLQGYVAPPEILAALPKNLGTRDTLGYPIAKEEAVAIGEYTGQAYSDMNDLLRGRNIVSDQKLNVTLIFALGSALTKLKTLVYTGEAYRTENADVGRIEEFKTTYKPGNIVLEKGFMSSTLLKNLNYAKPAANRVNLKYTIVSKTGVDITQFSNQKNSEKEILFNAGSVFKVLAFKHSLVAQVDLFGKERKDKTDVLEISLEEIVLPVE